MFVLRHFKCKPIILLLVCTSTKLHFPVTFYGSLNSPSQYRFVRSAPINHEHGGFNDFRENVWSNKNAPRRTHTIFMHLVNHTFLTTKLVTRWNDNNNDLFHKCAEFTKGFLHTILWTPWKKKNTLEIQKVPKTITHQPKIPFEEL